MSGSVNKVILIGNVGQDPEIRSFQSGGNKQRNRASQSKDEIRKICKNIGLTVYNRPSNSCLASRIPWGQRVTAERLTRIEMGETIIKQLTGFQQVRVRDLDGVAKIEIESSKVKLEKKEVDKRLDLIAKNQKTYKDKRFMELLPSIII